MDIDTHEDVQMQQETASPTAATAADPLAADLTDPLLSSDFEGGADGDAVQMGRNYLH